MLSDSDCYVLSVKSREAYKKCVDAGDTESANTIFQLTHELVGYHGFCKGLLRGMDTKEEATP
ncbi:MAG: hypothetical protein AAGF47_07055 [Planctomycetota bacterium]